jgi:hypothetical protein
VAVEISTTHIYTVKYLDEVGQLKMLDIPCAGMTAAKDLFSQQNPNCQVINIWRKS